MTMINTDAPGVTVETTVALPLTERGFALVRLQSWHQHDDGTDHFTQLVDLRLNADQAMQLAYALLERAQEASLLNSSGGRPV